MLVDFYKVEIGKNGVKKEGKIYILDLILLLLRDSQNV